jgi:hypothetical protein
MPLVIPTTPQPTLTGFISRVRLDLFDAGQRAGDLPRWLDDDLARALDRSNDAYSTVAPYLKQTLMPTAAGSRLYVRPDDAWWIDAVEYPFGLWPRWYQAVEERVSPFMAEPPANAGTVGFVIAPVGSPGLSAGAYSWTVSFVTPGGETLAVPLATGTASAGQAAELSGLPLGPYGVTGRRIYRSDGGDPALAIEITDNVTDSATDTGADLSSAPPAPSANTTQGVNQFEIQVSDANLPSAETCGGADPNYGWLGVRYATKHELDANGTTIPERHWDVLCLGAALFAISAYLVPTADNFHFVDGQVRDQLDDTKATANWLAVGADLERRWQTRIAEIKNESNAGVAAIGSWGDKPIGWDRL